MQTTKEKEKIFKDPIYGYVSIPQNYIHDIIDTAIFQRLRRVIQTSYSPLYASAMHNRFVHSIGVFHLGEIAAESMRTAILEKDFTSEEIVNNLVRVYKLACLLHDVGHSPFSHTGEIYYKYRKSLDSDEEECNCMELHNRLIQLTSDSLRRDLYDISESDSANPHEIMSAIIGISYFGDIIGDAEDKEFFARCITGYAYKEKDEVFELKNCFIKMLNSKVIDVDRLDYLIRDAYTTGFATISIDYERLLKAITIIRDRKTDKLCLAYKKMP